MLTTLSIRWTVCSLQVLMIQVCSNEANSRRALVENLLHSRFDVLRTEGRNSTRVPSNWSLTPGWQCAEWWSHLPGYKGIRNVASSLLAHHSASITTLSPMPSRSSRVAKSPLHSRLPSSEYLPVPRRMSGSQQSSSLLEASTLSDKSNVYRLAVRVDLVH